MDRLPDTDVQGDDPYDAAHPETLYVTAAARAFLSAQASSPSALEADGACAVWEALTGLDHAAAYEYAESITRDAVTAAVIPF